MYTCIWYGFQAQHVFLANLHQDEQNDGNENLPCSSNIFCCSKWQIKYVQTGPCTLGIVEAKNIEDLTKVI